VEEHNKEKEKEIDIQFLLSEIYYLINAYEKKDWQELTYSLIRIKIQFLQPYYYLLLYSGVVSSVLGSIVLLLSYIWIRRSTGVGRDSIMSWSVTYDIAMGLGARLGIWIFSLQIIRKLLKPTVYQILRKGYNTIRDENYLIGRRLKNNRKEDSPPSPSPSPSSKSAT